MIKDLLKFLLMLFPFILFALLNTKANLKKQYRSRQFLMPLLAIIYCIVLIIFASRLSDLLVALINLLPEWLMKLGEWISGLLGGKLASIGELVSRLAAWLAEQIMKANLSYLILFVFNAVFMLVHIILKKIFTAIMKGVFKTGNALYEIIAGLFYERDEETGHWCIKSNMGQARTFLKTFYYAAIILSVIAVLATCILYKNGLMTVPFYPVFGVIIVGEMYFFIDGLIKGELRSMLSGEDDDAEGRANYSLMRPVLRKLFGDKLGAEDTTIASETSNVRTNDEVIEALESSDDPKIEIYGKFMRKKLAKGLKMDRNYLVSGLDLLNGKSVLFNNPFYYDLIPYAFYPMNRTLLRHKKVLIILGRHGVEGDIENWCIDGLTSITNIPSMWRVGVLSEEPQDLDVGIITRSDVHDLKLHEANDAFFGQVEFAMLIEPSRLVTTAQVGLNSIVRHCRKDGKKMVFCSVDKNCDGLVDALSHILMTSIAEVSATNRHTGASSYMCWDTDGDHLQHRMLPNLSRYLGVGTEMSFAALKNQISKTSWYGGDAFPVVDMHWIAKQYYYDLMTYADRPATQEALDECFTVSHNMWNAKAEENHYMTVEDESYNMFEIKRDFATRATEQGFINVICSDYLLKDYMEENNGIFNADPKAIPYIVADYAHTERNVVLRLCLRMSAGPVPAEDVRRELMLIDAPCDDLRGSLWNQLCKHCCDKGSITPYDGSYRLGVEVSGMLVSFDSDVIRVKRKFSLKTGQMEEMYYISDEHFIKAVLGDLKSAGYIAEDENGERQYLGTELMGHVFQKYLPGQFFTFNGKYYEMLRVTSDGQVVVRRAADHITGRPSYRQIRNYTISNVTDSSVMGDCVDIGGLKVTKQYADVTVDTPAYWNLGRYHDFAHGRKVTINGIPQRVYRNKQILRVELPENVDGFNENVCKTITVLFNEVFRTLFAENQNYVAAVMPGEAELPMTYSLNVENGEAGKNCFYIIEDSQLDIGLLVAVKRNLNRIFAIICDYLDWHTEALEASLNPPPEPTPPDFTVEPEAIENEPKTWFGRLIKKIREFFKKIGGFFTKVFRKIGGFFKKLFGEKKKPEAEGTETENTPNEIEAAETAEGGAVSDGAADELTDIADEPTDEDAADEVTETADDASDGEEALESEEEETSEETHEEENAAEEISETESEADSEQETEESKTMESYKALFSMSGTLYEDSGEAEEAQAEETPAEEVPTEDKGEAAPVEEKAVEESESEPEDNDTLEFEGENAKKPSKILERLPYHQRYFLLYGGTELPTYIDVSGTLEYLKGLGFDDNELKQTRDGKGIADMIERNFVPDKKGTHYCDFCGTELVGTEYEVLADGRERCMTCGRTAVKTSDEFVAIHKEVIKNLDAFYCIKITAPVNIKMVNAKKLHKRLGRSFVPTGNADGRVLGVAIRDKDGYTILIENGSPRLQATMTMVHELTHIWQYLNWDDKVIRRTYGAAQELEVYEGMAKWSEIQYAYLINETASAKREEIITRMRNDEYGRGFNKYVAKYPLSIGTYLKRGTPFENTEKPL